MTRGGVFVVVEGGEATGKSTQVGLLAGRLRAAGHDVCTTREPGGTARGTRIRALLLDDHDALDERAELLLVLADRAQHVAEVVRPHLARGGVVVCDRYTPSTLAYQGVGRGLGVDEVERLSRWATGGLDPDVVVVLDVPTELAEQRAAGSRDRMELAGAQFHADVREAYRALAARYGWVVVDGVGTPDDVAARVWDAVRPALS